MYKDFKKEVDYNQDRIILTSAALLQNGFNVEALTRYIGGPHIGAHRDLAQIRARLTPGVEPDLINSVINVFEYGAPQQVHAYSSNKNFMAYWNYGNHSSCDLHKKEFKGTIIKDVRRGNIALLDKTLILFIPHLHLTPQGLVDVENKWKSCRPVFDASFRPD